jgi:hypothetical protein
LKWWQQPNEEQDQRNWLAVEKKGRRTITFTGNAFGPGILDRFIGTPRLSTGRSDPGHGQSQIRSRGLAGPAGRPLVPISPGISDLRRLAGPPVECLKIKKRREVSALFFKDRIHTFPNRSLRFHRKQYSFFFDLPGQGVLVHEGIRSKRYGFYPGIDGQRQFH